MIKIVSFLFECDTKKMCRCAKFVLPPPPLQKSLLRHCKLLPNDCSPSRKAFGTIFMMVFGRTGRITNHSQIDLEQFTEVLDQGKKLLNGLNLHQLVASSHGGLASLQGALSKGVSLYSVTLGSHVYISCLANLFRVLDLKVTGH